MANKPVLHNPVHLLATGFGAGLAPFAPGTFGTLVGIAFYLPLDGLPLAVYLGAVLVLLLVGVPLCGITARDLEVDDHPGIVWDEIVGYLVTMAGAPSGWPWVVAGFALFRFFDVLKPWPIRAIDERMTGGAGIMLDDVLAGIFAGACLQVAHYATSQL